MTPHTPTFVRCSRRSPAGSVISSKMGVLLYGAGVPITFAPSAPEARRSAEVCDPPHISNMQPDFGSVVRISCDQRRVVRLAIQLVRETMIDVAMMGFVRAHQQHDIA